MPTLDFQCDCGNRESVEVDERRPWVWCPACGRVSELRGPGNGVTADPNTYALAELTAVPLPDVNAAVSLPSADIEPLDLVTQSTPPPGLFGRRRRRPTPPGPVIVTAVGEGFLWGNLTSFAVVTFFHLVALSGATMVLAGTTWSGIPLVQFIPPLALLWIALWGHFANVIDETGPRERDELSRFLRDLSWGDDLWGPCTRLFGALLLAYWPALLALWLPLPPAYAQPLAFVLAVLGSYFAPALLLTAIGGDTFIDMRPARALGLTPDGRRAYDVLACQWGIGLGLYLVGLYAAQWAMYVACTNTWIPAGCYAASFVLLLVGLVAMHWTCRAVGLFYREYHASFPWPFRRRERPFVWLAPQLAARLSADRARVDAGARRNSAVARARAWVSRRRR